MRRTHRSTTVSCATLVVVGFMAVPSHVAGQAGPPLPGLTSLGAPRWQMTTEVLVGPGHYANNEDPSCEGSVDGALSSIAGLIGPLVASPPLAALVSEISYAVVRGIESYLRTQPGAIANLLAPVRLARCEVVGVVVPLGATVESVEYRVGDGDRGWASCTGKLNNGGLGCESFAGKSMNQARAMQA